MKVVSEGVKHSEMVVVACSNELDVASDGVEDALVAGRVAGAAKHVLVIAAPSTFPSTVTDSTQHGTPAAPSLDLPWPLLERVRGRRRCPALAAQSAPRTRSSCHAALAALESTSVPASRLLCCAPPEACPSSTRLLHSLPAPLRSSSPPLRSRRPSAAPALVLPPAHVPAYAVAWMAVLWSY